MIDSAHQPFEQIAHRLRIGQYKKRCPACQGSRTKHKHDTPLSIKITTDGVRYHCHHCEASGGWMHEQQQKQQTRNFTFNDNSKPTVTGKEYLISRGISEEVVDAFTVTGQYSFGGRSEDAIGFPYKYGEQVAVKWRSTDTRKLFRQQNVCEDFFLMETHKPGNSILICEGEIDALAWRSAGIPSDVTVVSVPNGAPQSVKEGRVDATEDKKFRYVFRARLELENAARIYLNTDNDGPGQALAEELSRRIGRAKTWIVKLPKKDAAATLFEDGAEALRKCFERSEPMPMLGLSSPEEFDDDYCALYDNGRMHGASTGLGAVDRLVSIPLGMVTIVTGFPGSGKSDLIDQFCLNLARDVGWKTVYCSFEKPPTYHMAQLAQKITGKAFFEETSKCERMSPMERDAALNWIKENFMFMDSSKGGPTDIDGILDMASAAVMRMGCRVLVIDPYNYVTIDKNNGKETDAISNMLTKIRTWARTHDAHVFFIAHPAKPDIRQGKYVCSGFDVSGSASWFSKADIGMTAWRSADNESELHVWKVRWSWMGSVGMCKLSHTPANSRWSDHEFTETYDWGDPNSWSF